MTTQLLSSLARLSPLHVLSGLHFGFSLPAPLLAAADVAASINSFLDFVQKLLVLPALALVLYSAWMFHENNRIRETAMALAGALLLALAVPIVKAIFGF
jgi:hypothetical protein